MGEKEEAVSCNPDVRMILFCVTPVHTVCQLLMIEYRNALFGDIGRNGENVPRLAGEEIKCEEEYVYMEIVADLTSKT